MQVLVVLRHKASYLCNAEHCQYSTLPLKLYFNFLVTYLDHHKAQGEQLELKFVEKIFYRELYKLHIVLNILCRNVLELANS